MKRIFAAALVLTAVMLALPRFFWPTAAEPETPEPTPDKTAAPLDSDKSRTVRLLSGDTVTEIGVFDYLTGVVAAEMPVSFEPEALKAQAVAARSYLQRFIAEPKHEGADICADSSCCQAYLTPDELMANWGDDYNEYAKKISAAVEATDGEYLSYDGQAALCAFHSSSEGATESSADVWSDVPYLRSVESPETAEEVPNFVSTVESADIDFRDTILYLHPEADMTGSADSWISDTRRTGSGRVAAMVIGGVEFTGGELRRLFSLRSTDFDISHDAGKFVFTVRGYGHGVGMSQYGANALARSGEDYRAILGHYYPGTVLVSCKE